MTKAKHPAKQAKPAKRRLKLRNPKKSKKKNTPPKTQITQNDRHKMQETRQYIASIRATSIHPHPLKKFKMRSKKIDVWRTLTISLENPPFL